LGKGTSSLAERRGGIANYRRTAPEAIRFTLLWMRPPPIALLARSYPYSSLISKKLC
jgi:hypothetical protein